MVSKVGWHFRPFICDPCLTLHGADEDYIHTSLSVRDHKHYSLQWYEMCCDDISRNNLSYPGKLYPSPRCRDARSHCHHSWCRGCRGPVNFPGPSTCPPRTPRRSCHDLTRSLTVRHGLQGTWCRVRTAATVCSYSSHSCMRTWHRWSQCTAFSWWADLCILCRADISLCG